MSRIENGSHINNKEFFPVVSAQTLEVRESFLIGIGFSDRDIQRTKKN
jgi:hypothetical protein